MKIEKVLVNNDQTSAIYKGGKVLPVICWAVIEETEVVYGDVEVVNSVVGMVPHMDEIVLVKEAGNFLKYEVPEEVTVDR